MMDCKIPKMQRCYKNVRLLQKLWNSLSSKSFVYVSESRICAFHWNEGFFISEMWRTFGAETVTTYLEHPVGMASTGAFLHPHSMHFIVIGRQTAAGSVLPGVYYSNCKEGKVMFSELSMIQDLWKAASMQSLWEEETGSCSVGNSGN